MDKEVFKPKIRVSLLSDNGAVTSDRLVDAYTELNAGPKEAHNGPIRIEITLTSSNEIANFKAYLDRLTGSLPLKVTAGRGRPATGSNVELENPREEILADITKMEILIFMQDHKLLDDELNDMEIKEFVETDIFRRLFAVDTSIRSRKNPIRTVENKRVKMNTVVYGLKEVIEEDDVNSEGLLTGYFYDFLSRK